MRTSVRISRPNGDVVLTSICRYQPITIGTQRETSQTVYFYRDVRLQLPWDVDTTGVGPNMKVEVIASDNEQLIGRVGSVKWAQDSDIVLERTILMVEDMRDRAG